MRKVIVVLGLYRLSIAKKVENAKTIVTSMTGNPNFPTPSPTLASISANITALEMASVAAANGGATETANMHAKEHVLDLGIKLLGSYVENIANATPIYAEEIIRSAGMNVKASSVRTAYEFSAKNAKTPGSIKLATKSVLRASYIWQICTDPSTESNWKTLSMITLASYTATGLISGTKYYFRVSVVDKNGQGPWSNVLNIIAL